MAVDHAGFLELCHAADLQGISKGSPRPPWSSKYTININAEVNDADVDWKGGKPVRATIRSTQGLACRVRYGDKVVSLAKTRGGRYVFDGALDGR